MALNRENFHLVCILYYAAVTNFTSLRRNKLYIHSTITIGSLAYEFLKLKSISE